MLKKYAYLLTLTSMLFTSSIEATYTNSRVMKFSGGSLMDHLVNQESGSGLLVKMTVLSFMNSGTLTLDTCTILEKSANENQLYAENTIFKEKLVIKDGLTILTNCRLEELHISDKKKSPIVYLRGETVIEGNIVFKEGTGKVYVKPSVILNGEIIGGEIIEDEDA